jgi:hypothetical protein
MRKKIVLICGIITVLLSFWTLYYAYSPKVGPIGNGPNYLLIWFQFSILFISGVCSILLVLSSKKK